MEPNTELELGIGLIGVGRHGSRYVQHLLHDLPGVRIAAVSRRNVAETIVGSRAPIYDDYHAMILDPSVQAVVAVTPPSLCRDICLATVRAGKPILIEKPLATSGTDARAMVAAAEEAGVILMTAQTMRYDPTIILLKEKLRGLGPLKSGNLITHIETKAGRLSGGKESVPVGALLELGVHLLDLVRFLTGQEIRSVECTMNPQAPYAVETQAQVRLQTTDGVMCTLDIARAKSKRIGTAEWVGTLGTIKADWPQRKVVETSVRGEIREWIVEPRPTILATLQAFVASIQTGTPAPITGLDGCLAVEAAEACYQSAAQNGSIIALAPFRC
ncbi:Gfo/Idh/MocA family protein [Petrachloros mirabilis]